VVLLKCESVCLDSALLSGKTGSSYIETRSSGGTCISLIEFLRVRYGFDCKSGVLMKWVLIGRSLSGRERHFYSTIVSMVMLRRSEV
jgi:hypothetical protein